MAVERTLSIIKPDAVEKNTIGGIVAMIEAAGLKVKAMKMIHLSRPQAEGFYAVHKARPFFGELVEFMTRSPVVVMCLEGENAIAQVPRGDGRDRSGQGRRGHDPQEVRREHRRERLPRLGRPGHRGGRDRLLLPRLRSALSRWRACRPAAAAPAARRARLLESRPRARLAWLASLALLRLRRSRRCRRERPRPPTPAASPAESPQPGPRARARRGAAGRRGSLRRRAACARAAARRSATGAAEPG